MSKVKNIFQWIFVAFCFLAALVYGFTFGSLLALICGVVALPIKPIRNLWEKFLPQKLKWVKRVGIIVLFFISMSVMPVTETEPTDNVKIEQTAKDEKDKTDASKDKKADSKKEETADKKNETDKKAESNKKEETTKPSGLAQTTVDLSSVGTYSGKAYVALNNNTPTFAEVSTKSFEKYANLDSLGRCGVAYACVGKDIMPTEERGSIGQVKPTGWHTVKYDVVDGKYLYNRCHLIGYQLTGENANTKNLITGTRYMNVDGMLPFENMVADYVQETGNHVMYRVTPHFSGSNLLASGVQMEAYSVEDNGAGVCFNVYVYNAQPGITINYANGDSSLTQTASNSGNTSTNNTNSNNAGSTGNTTSSNSGNTNNTTSSNSGNTGTSNENNNTLNNTTSSGSGGSELVWLAATGDKYHTINNCGRMNPDKAYQVTKAEAEADGKEPCSKCH